MPVFGSVNAQAKVYEDSRGIETSLTVQGNIPGKGDNSLSVVPEIPNGVTGQLGPGCASVNKESMNIFVDAYKQMESAMKAYFQKVMNQGKNIKTEDQ